MPFLVPLRHRDCGQIEAVGGKAVNLHRLLVAELPVPDGFCVTTQAYRLAVEPLADQLGALFDEARAQASAEHDPTDVAGRIRGLVGAGALPQVVQEAVLAAYRELSVAADDRGSGAVAVRSSATAEDLADASFAGQQDTYLNVVGEAALLDAIRACWASLWTDRAVAYRAGQGIDPADVSLAVVVQRMVPAEAAGVMFTADPVTGSRARTSIDANHGLGESVVSGEVNPDRYVVETAGGVVVSTELGDKHVAVRARPGGGVVRETAKPTGGDDSAGRDTAGTGDRVLTDAQLADLTALGARVAALFDAPQDIEWALDAAGRFWLTQTRPVTTLYPLVHFVGDPRSPSGRSGPALDRPGRRVFLCASLAQGLTRPITPLGRGSIRLLTTAGARLAGLDVPDARVGAPFYAEGGERIFGDVTTALRDPVGRRLVRFAFAYMEARSAAALAHLEAEPAFALQDAATPTAPTAPAGSPGDRGDRAPRAPGRRLRRARTVAATIGQIARFWIATGIPAKALLAVRDPDLAVRRAEAEIDGLRHCLDLPADATATERLDAIEALLSSPRGMVMPAIAGYAIPGFLALGVAGRLLRGQIGPGELQAVLRGLPHNVTTQMDLELWDLSRQLAPQESDPGGSKQRLAGFLERWGDRAVAEIDLGMPRWREQPEHLLGTLRNYALVTDDSAGPRAVFERGRREGEAAVRRLLDRAGGPVRRALLAFALDRARRLVGLREAPKFGLVTVLARAREQYHLIGAELAAADLLDTRDDVFFLDLWTLRDGVDALSTRCAGAPSASPDGSPDGSGAAGGADGSLRATVAANRAAYDRELRRRHIPRLVLSDGTEVEALAPAAPGPRAPGLLAGTPASAGLVTGPARVVTDPAGAHLEPGEILVAPSTDPGWTPLFLTAGGLVMEMGGSNSHGAVVAREYGIPAVVGVEAAASRIRTGQQVVVDGAAGTVRIVTPEEVSQGDRERPA